MTTLTAFFELNNSCRPREAKAVELGLSAADFSRPTLDQLADPDLAAIVLARGEVDARLTRCCDVTTHFVFGERAATAKRSADEVASWRPCQRGETRRRRRLKQPKEDSSPDAVGRVHSVSASQVECFHLRLLLHHVRMQLRGDEVPRLDSPPHLHRCVSLERPFT